MTYNFVECRKLTRAALNLFGSLGFLILFHASLLLAQSGVVQHISAGSASKLQTRVLSANAAPLVTGSRVYWFVMSTNDYGAAPISMILPTATGAQTDQSGNSYVLTAADGSFNISAWAACPTPNSFQYVLALGGNFTATGLSNPYFSDISIIPVTCGNSWNVKVAETETIAAAYALASFATVPSNSFATNTASVPALQAAVAYANTITNSTTGYYSPTSAWRTTLNTLSDMLYACNLSTDGAQCTALMAAATPPGGFVPTNTVQAMLSIALNPSLNLSALFNAITPSDVFQPVLPSLPTLWVLPGSSVQITGISPLPAPAGASVTIIGSGFGTSHGSGLLVIGGVQATIISWSDSAIVATVPSGAASNGFAQIYQAGLASNPVPFSVGPNYPTVTQISSDVASSNYGQSVTFSALVNTGGRVPTGTVAFFDGGSQIGNGVLGLINATNLVPYSQQIGNPASWGGYCGSLSNATVNTGDLIAPDGSMTATKFVVDGPVCGSPSGTSNGAITTLPGGLTTGQTYTVSAWLRGAVGGEHVNLGLNDCAQYGVQLTTSWVRYSHTFAAIPNGISGCATGPRGLQFTGANETYYIWGAQLEQLITFGNPASWGGYCGSLSNATVNTGDLFAPDGSTTATKFVVDGPVCGSPSGTSNGAITTLPGGLTTGQTYTVSAWLRGAVGGEHVNLGLNDCAQYGVQLTTSWVRYSRTFAAIPNGISGCATGPRGLEFLGANETYYIWKAQVEQSATVGPYIQTDASARSGYGGISTFVTNALGQGTHGITASYSGDSNNSGSSSSTISVEVLQPPIGVPAISSVSTASGVVGTSVTIVGSNFGVSQGSNTITFNGVPGIPNSWSDTTIIVPVPNGATSGNIVVTVNGNASNGMSFIVTSGTVPAILGVSRSIASVGASITIFGVGFGTQGQITFNGVPATPQSWSDTQILVKVPLGATPGPIVVSTGGVSSMGFSFSIPPLPTVVGVSISSGPPGMGFVISGSGFGPIQGSNTVTIGDAVAPVISWSDTLITATVPPTAQSGPITITTFGAPSLGYPFFTVTSEKCTIDP